MPSYVPRTIQYSAVLSSSSQEKRHPYGYDDARRYAAPTHAGRAGDAPERSASVPYDLGRQKEDVLRAFSDAWSKLKKGSENGSGGPPRGHRVADQSELQRPKIRHMDYGLTRDDQGGGGGMATMAHDRRKKVSFEPAVDSIKEEKRRPDVMLRD